MKEKLLSLFALLLMIVTGAWAEDMKTVPLTLEAKTTGTIVVSSPKTGMKYSLDGGETKNDVTAPFSIEVAIGDKVAFYGSGTSIKSYYGTNIAGGTADCYIYGNIMSLVDESGFATATTLTGGLSFGQLFLNNANLYNHASKDLVLPATTLISGCYGSMFQGCTNLTTAPALPATTLENNCYQMMFYGCTSLTTAPELPATTLAGYCYDSMFEGCTNLTTAPVLPATTLAQACYSGMFHGCTGLVSAPVLPATTLASDCYYSMFQGCSSLTSAPALPATTLASDCYNGMFQNCTNLTAAPALPATTLANSCYYSMFQGCTSLNSAPALPATTLASDCYNSMFQNCTNLTTAPALPATTLASDCYNSMFNGCTSLTSAPALPATTLVSSCYQFMFQGCSSLNSVTCLATDISANIATFNWLKDVAATGTFNKPSATNWGVRSASKIPTGWTMVNNDPVTLTDGEDLSSLTPCAGGVCEVNYSREFTESKPSTVCLPFAYEVKDGEKFYTFDGITKDDDEYVATMTLYSNDNLVANTPYLYVSATTGATDFSGTYTLPAEITAGTTTSGDWKFIGTYTTQTWDVAPTGIYGFSAKDANDGITQGEFVKVGAYVRVKPMRCYLKYKDGDEDYSAARSFSKLGASTMETTVSELLPERIKVRFVDANGEVTGIGTLDTQTGEVNFDSKAWYTLDGVRLAGKPTKQGIYVNNGKKVVVK